MYHVKEHKLFSIQLDTKAELLLLLLLLLITSTTSMTMWKLLQIGHTPKSKLVSFQWGVITFDKLPFVALTMEQHRLYSSRIIMELHSLEKIWIFTTKNFKIQKLDKLAEKKEKKKNIFADFPHSEN